MFFASMLAMVVLGVIGFGLIIAAIVSVSSAVMDKENNKTSGEVLVIDMEKRIHEQGQTNSLAVLSNSAGYEAGLYDIMNSLTYAKTDANIKGILLKLAPSPNGWATLQQLRAALVDFKGSGKFVYAYGENISQGAYFAASAADSIYLNPAGNIDHKGFATVLAFFKGTLDKLELQPEIFYAGRFKSATEPFRAEKMSDPNRMQIQAFQNGLWDQYTSAVAGYTKTDKAAVNQLAQDGTIQFPSDALKNKMVAGLLYWDEVEQRMRSKVGKAGVAEVKYVSISDYAMNHKGDGKISEDKVAILFAEGSIVDGQENDAHQVHE